jgi:hypothetical protein
VPEVESALDINGLLDQAAWEKALSLSLDFEVMPGEKLPSEVRTEVQGFHANL